MAKSKVWVDPDSGTFGMNDILFIELSREEVAFFAELSDYERIQITRIFNENSDQPGYDFYSAYAAYETQRAPDCGNPGPDCKEHDGRCD